MSDFSPARRITPRGCRTARGWFLSGRTGIIRYDLVAGDETVLHRGEDPPTRGTVQEPELLTDSLVALTLRHVPEESVGVLDLTTGSYTPVSTSRACQITWIPGRRHLVWMDDGGRGGTRVMHGSMDGPQGEVLMDLPHEYFPRITADGEWMIWGAAAEGHEHDRADYELFAWKLDQPWSSAVRLTYSESNEPMARLLPWRLAERRSDGRLKGSNILGRDERNGRGGGPAIAHGKAS